MKMTVIIDNIYYLNILIVFCVSLNCENKSLKFERYDAECGSFGFGILKFK